MASIYDKASLVLIPSGTKTSKVYSQKPTNGDGDFTFSRSTAATRVNASGNIEKETQNLLLQSNQFDTTWVLEANDYTLTSGQSGYDGSNNAWLLNKLSTQNRYLIQSNLTNIGVVTLSIYAKAGTADGIMIYSHDGYTRWNLSTGSRINGGNNIDDSIEDVGNGWYRCSVVSGGTGVFFVKVVDYLGVEVAGNIYIQDAQLEQGLVARDYIETTTTAIYGGITDNVPRLDYTDSSCPALLLEPQRTNVVTQSEYFTDIFTENSGVTWESNSTTSPEGLVNAFKLNNSNASSSGAYYVPLAFTDNDTMTASIFAKEGDVSELLFGITNQNESKSLYYSFDLSAGTATYNANNGGILNGSGSIVDYGNGWYRCIVTGTFPSSGTTSGGVFPRIPQAGYVYLYGLQVEKNGSYATSYIPTYGSAVTRNVESAQGLNIPQMPTSYPFTLYGEGYVQPSGDDYVMSFINGTSSNTYFSLRILNRYPKANSRTGTGEYTATGTILPVGRYKTAVIYTDTQIKMYVNGELMDSVSNANAFTTGMDDLLLGQLRISADSGSRMPVYQAMVFNQELSNQEAIDLTTL